MGKRVAHATNVELTMSLPKKYAKSNDLKWSLRFRTSHPAGDDVDGVVLHNARNFIVIKEMINLDFDGIVILPKKILKGYRDGKVEKCLNRILMFNGNIKKARMPRWLNKCNSIPEIIQQLMKRQIWPSVEIVWELDGKIESDFFIGPITQIDDNEFWIHDYEATGRWGYEWFIRFDEILKIKFEDRYSNAFNEFMRSIERPTPTRYGV